MAPITRLVLSDAGLPQVLQKHTMTQLEQWMRDAPRTSGDIAYNFYKLMPQYNGIKQVEFRQLWKATKNTSRGAQKKSKS